MLLKLRLKYILVNKQKHVTVCITHCNIPLIHRTFSFHLFAFKELIYLLTLIYTLKINATFYIKIKETNKNKRNIYRQKCVKCFANRS